MLNPDIYNIKNTLGQGGMAEVFLAEDLRFHSNVAVKILNKELTHNSNISQRFIAEARNLFRLSHPNIVRVVDLIDTPDLKAFVMDFIEGESLKAVIERGNISKENLNLWLNQMLDALGYCHQNGLIHRDIKPSNFMVDKHCNIKLLDFGIAKNLNNGGEYTQTGTSQMLGTPIYMSPEQVLETKTVNERSDIYSLGVVLWQMLAGKKPYDSNTLSTFQIQSKIVNEPLPLLNSVFDGIIQKCTAKEPGNRFANCQEIKIALTDPGRVQAPQIVTASTVEQSQPTPGLGADKTLVEIKNTSNESTPPKKRKSKQRLILSIAFGFVLIISGVLYYFFRDWDGDGIAYIYDKCPDHRGFSSAEYGCPDTDRDNIIDSMDKCYTIPGKKENSGCPMLWKNVNGSIFVEKGKDGIWREGPGPEPRFQWKEIRWSNDSCFFESLDRPGYIMILTKEKFLFKYNKKDLTFSNLHDGGWSN
jgi:serine/threonine protein kinase